MKKNNQHGHSGPLLQDCRAKSILRLYFVGNIYIIYWARSAESTHNQILGKWRPVKGLEPRTLMGLVVLSLSQFLLSCSFFFLSSLASSCSFSSLVKKRTPASCIKKPPKECTNVKEVKLQCRLH